MKNLKKISRKDLKNLIGGKNLGIEESLSDGEAVEKKYRCCDRLYDCGGCGYSSNCPSGKFLQGCF
ncbi:MAG: hypothetical protein K0R77_913 [Chryseobacterium sp.]|jgi:hypothetical protein|uniref:bacteriocin-like protein n=1 Tax=Chryseobacterium sp. TaxID=1871047 RepID=UPI002633320D|nr:hypothetical protein [Chryseobacterium sp.]MDF2551638.1 hypothetical protein [Chryseobacterium sp.]